MDARPRPLRRDADANRQRLLDAASDLFAQHGLGVTLNDIAHHAGVGVGTAYRRFHNKEALIDVLFDRRVQAVEAVAREALADEDAWHGLVLYLKRALQMQFGDRGLSQILNDPTLGDARINDVRVRIAPLVVALVERAQDQRVVRRDFAPTDVIFIQAGLSAIVEITRDRAPNFYERYLTFFLDGIRADREQLTPLPVAALTSEVTHMAMTRQRRPGHDR